MLGILIGVTAAIGFSIKPTVIIAVIAILVTHILFTKMNKKCLIRSAATLASIIIVFGGAAISIQTILNNQNILKIEQNVSTPLTHFFMMGMNEMPVNGRSYYGAWYDKDVEFTFSKKTTDEKKEANIEVIKSRFKEYGVTGYAKHLVNKARWITSEGNFFWGGEGGFAKWSDMKSDTLRELFTPGGQNYRVYLYFSQAVWIIAMLGMVIPLLFNKINSRNKTLLMLRLSSFGILLFIMLFEGRSRYLMNYLPCFIVLASYGFSCMLNKQKLKVPKFLKKR